MSTLVDAPRRRRRPRRVLGLARRHLFSLYLLVGSVAIVIGVTIYTINVARNVERQSYLTTQLFSGLASRLLLSEDTLDKQQVIQIINEIEVPLIITDNSGRPLLWNAPVIGIPIPDYRQLLAEDPAEPRHPDVMRILQLAEEFDAEQQPFAIVTPDGRRLGTLHYGKSELSQQIRLMPYLELMIMALYFLLILWAFQSKRDAEQQALFAGMAKETAHQLGTPLTSVLGWLAILRERVGPDDDAMHELEHDVERLGKVSARFSQIGSQPKLDDTDLAAVVDETIGYFQRRLPHLGGRVHLRREGEVTGRARFNRDLMAWVLENLLKNGMDALKQGKGTITVRLSDLPSGAVALRVSDTGCGLASGVGNKIFAPGFTTKERGWGMGLALVKRIVTQYHGGRIRVEETGPRGTTFLIVLPGEET
ncbi:MAG: ATP-binding protein [Candidatus Krumholzibacteriia bacterium]